MKNPRTIAPDTAVLTLHDISDAKPPKDSLFWQMWQQCQDIAETAYATEFIQAIKAGTLDPVVYGGFNVSDGYYCFHGADDYKQAAERAKHPVLKSFLQSKYQSYADYNKTFPETWRVKDAQSIIPTQVCKDYTAFEAKIAATEDPIYLIPLMLPCEYLWYWLANKMGAPTKGNLYADWITGNDSADGAYTMGNFLELYRRKYEVDEQKAIAIYRQAMCYEMENFRQALTT